MKRVVFAVLCCTLLMLFAAPAMGGRMLDRVSRVPSCGVTITITDPQSGQPSGNLVVTFGGSGAALRRRQEDQLVGITNNSSVAVGAIVLSAPASSGESLFQFDGDGPCVFFGTAPATAVLQIRMTMKVRTTHSSASAPTSRPGRFCSRSHSRPRVGPPGFLWRTFLPPSWRSGRTRR